MSPRVSLVVPTNRPGGLDVLFRGLEVQTFRDFELVFVDNLKPWRCRDRRSEIDLGSYDGWFGVKHVEPSPNRFPLNSYSASMNAGLRVAEGDIVLLSVDYTYFHPTAIERHVRRHDELGERFVVQGVHDNARCPPINRFLIDRYRLYDESHYTTRGMDRMICDLNSGFANGLEWSIFEEEWLGAIETLPPEDRFGSDPKCGSKPHVSEMALWFYCRNESVRREDLITIGGFDEAYDGSHGYQDCDIADRLELEGLRFFIDPDIRATIVNPRPYFPHGVRERPISANEAYWRTRKAAGYPRVPTYGYP